MYEKTTKKKYKKRLIIIIGIVIGVLAALLIIRYFIMNKLYARMTFIGHASVKIKTTTGEVIYIDPYFPTDSYKEPADVILVTHGHSDHNRVDLCEKKDDCKIIKWKDALIDGEYQVFEFDNIRIEAVPSGGNSSHSLNSNVGYVITVDGVTVYHSGDTSFAEETKCIADKDIDYAMYTVNGVYTMGPEEATQMADYIGAGVNIPIHGNDKQYWKQRRRFNARGTKRLFWGQTIFLRKRVWKSKEQIG